MSVANVVRGKRDRNRRKHLHADELTLISAGWSDAPNERQLRERRHVVRQRATQQPFDEDVAEARQNRMRQAADVFRGEDMRTAVLAMLGAAAIFNRHERPNEAFDVLFLAVRLFVRVRLAVQLGKCSEQADPLKSIQKLRSSCMMEREEFEMLRKVLQIKKVTPASIERLQSVVHQCADFFAPIVHAPRDFSTGKGVTLIS